jgi:hypothetical protein
MSPAQKIRKALAERYCCEPDDIPRSMSEMESVACIVLRAAADEVVPVEEEPVPEADSVVELQIWSAVAQRQRTRRKLLAIAAELEAQP